MSKPLRKKKKERFWFGLAILGILSFNLLIPGCAGERGLPPEVSNGFERIAEYKSKIEQSALTIKMNWASGSSQYKEVEALYGDAKAAFDVWVERLKFDLVLDNDIATSEHYTKSLHETAKKGETLVTYVTKASARPLAAEPISIIGTLSDAGMKIWKEYNAAQKGRKDEILEILGQLKWKHFRDVK